jgi:hypothetical protein
MFQKVVPAWRQWREQRRQYAIERALYKASGGGTHPSMDQDLIMKQESKAGGAPVETFTKFQE